MDSVLYYSRSLSFPAYNSCLLSLQEKGLLNGHKNTDAGIAKKWTSVCQMTSPLSFELSATRTALQFSYLWFGKYCLSQ